MPHEAMDIYNSNAVLHPRNESVEAGVNIHVSERAHKSRMCRLCRNTELCLKSDCLKTMYKISALVIIASLACFIILTKPGQMRTQESIPLSNTKDADKKQVTRPRKLSAPLPPKRNNTFFLFGDSSQWTADHIQAYKRAKTLHWRGHIDVNGLFQVLDGAMELETLNLDNCCDDINANKKTKLLESPRDKPILLGNLRHLTFVNFTFNAKILKLFARNVLSSRLEEINMLNTDIAGTDAQNFKNFIEENKQTLRKLSLCGKTMTSWVVNSNTARFPNIIELNFPLEKDALYNIHLCSGFQEKFPRLKIFNSVSALIGLLDVHKLFKCVQLERISLGLFVPKGKNFVNLKVFQNAPKSLREMDTMIHFEGRAEGEVCDVEGYEEASQFSFKLLVQKNC